jgi:hypothetical protein
MANKITTTFKVRSHIRGNKIITGHTRTAGPRTLATRMARVRSFRKKQGG